MEVLIGGAVIGLGYLFSKEGINRSNTKFSNKVKGNQIPNGDTIYQSNRSYDIWQKEQKDAQKLFKKTENPEKTNVIIPGPTFKKVKVDYSDKQLPIEFNSNQNYQVSYLDLNSNNQTGPQLQDNKSLNNAQLPYTGGWNGINTDSVTPNDLFAETRNVEGFQHNNMVPFFGSNVKQNVDQFANRSIMENFTGNIDNYQKKKECGTFFKPQRNLSNVYGMQNFDSNLYDRFQTSRVRNNEAPIEQVRVGPGLNKGYTWKGSGGFQQANTRDYVLPKKTNEIRVLNNPKVTFKGRVISGQHIAQPGKIGTVQKNLPDTFYVQQPDRYFTTTGQTIGQTEYPEYIVKHTNRKTTELERRVGSAAPVNGTVENIRSKVKRSSKLTLNTSEPRNATIEGQWSIDPNASNHLNLNNGQGSTQVPNDYGRSSLTNKPNARMKTGIKTVVLNKKSVIEGGEYRNGQGPRHTRKTNFVGNHRWASNVQAPHNRHIVYDPNDVARTTIKETNLHDSNGGNMGIQAPARPRVYDPNDVARTTIKETNLHNSNGGNMGIQGPSRQRVYDPNDVARTTIKETNLHDSNGGNMGIQAPDRPRVYDPNDVARTTIKETTIDDNRVGGMGAMDNLKSVVYDPNDIARITNKQTTIAQNVMGNFQKQEQGSGYLNKNVEASETNRQNLYTDYTGNSKGQVVGGYKIAEATPRDTKKQFLSNHEYTGNAGAFQQKPMSYMDIYNATISNNKAPVEGRVPNVEGNKGSLGSADINMTTTRNGININRQLNERGVQPSVLSNSIPQNVLCSETRDRGSLPNAPLANRLDPRMVDQFKKNPYTQSLSSYAFP